MSARVEWSTIPAPAKRRIEDFGDVQELFDRHSEDDRMFQPDHCWNDAWDALLPARQLQILTLIRAEFMHQTLSLGTVIELLENQIYGVNKKAHARGQMRVNSKVIVPRPSDSEAGRNSVPDNRRESSEPSVQSYP